MEVNNPQNGMNRREFLGKYGAALVGASLGAIEARAYSVAPARVLGANDTINFALIGCGMRGVNHLSRLTQLTKDPESKVRLAAVCEIYDRRKEMLKTQSGLDKCYHNYEDILASPDIDAIVIAVPDHWHKKMSIDAMSAGKHVYCEKPMTLHLEEARDVMMVQKLTGKTFQVGAQSASQDRWWVARKLIGDGTNGIAGKVLQFQTSYNRNVPGGDWNYPIAKDGNAKTIDWERWLGPAPKREFDAERFFRFRKYWDYSGGLATDLMYHQLSHMSVALGFPFPTQVSGIGGNFIHFDREVPDTFTITANYSNGCTGTIFATSGNNTDLEETIRCQHGTITFPAPNEVLFRPQSAFHAQVMERIKEIPEANIGPLAEGGKLKAAEIRLPAQAFANDSNLHMDNFIKAMRTGEKPPLDAEEGYRVMATIALGIKAYREGRVCKFDPSKGAEIG